MHINACKIQRISIPRLSVRWLDTAIEKIYNIIAIEAIYYCNRSDILNVIINVIM